MRSGEVGVESSRVAEDVLLGFLVETQLLLLRPRVAVGPELGFELALLQVSELACVLSPKSLLGVVAHLRLIEDENIGSHPLDRVRLVLIGERVIVVLGVRAGARVEVVSDDHRLGFVPLLAPVLFILPLVSVSEISVLLDVGSSVALLFFVEVEQRAVVVLGDGLVVEG